MLSFPLLLRAWTQHVTLLTNGRFEIPAEVRTRLGAAGVHIEERGVVRLNANQDGLESIELADGDALPCEVLFAHPPQRQVDIVQSLGVTLNPAGYVQVDEIRRETSIPGVYAGGDLLTPMQGAIIAAASGVHAAAMLNHELSVELATSGALP